MKIIINQPSNIFEKLDYKIADEQLDAWVDDKNFKPALELLQSLKQSCPHRNADNFDYRIWIFNELNQFDNKMAELLDAALNNVFFPLEDEGYSNGVKQHAEFQKLLQKNRLALDKLKNTAEAELVIYRPSGTTNGELLLILHGNGQFNESITEQWPPNAYLESGFAVAYLQSPQVYCTDGFYWTEHYSENRLTIKQTFEIIKAELNIDAGQISLAGFSGGAMVSMSAVTHGIVKPKQVLAFMPQNGDYIGNIPDSGTPICIFKAEFDNNIDNLYAALDAYNLMYITINGLGHALPADMASYVLPYLNKPK